MTEVASPSITLTFPTPFFSQFLFMRLTASGFFSITVTLSVGDSAAIAIPTEPVPPPMSNTVSPSRRRSRIMLSLRMHCFVIGISSRIKSLSVSMLITGTLAAALFSMSAVTTPVPVYSCASSADKHLTSSSAYDKFLPTQKSALIPAFLQSFATLLTSSSPDRSTNVFCECLTASISMSMSAGVFLPWMLTIFASS